MNQSLEMSLLLGMLFFLMIGMGATLTLGEFRQVLKNPKPFIVGLASQFGWMPLIAFLLSYALNLNPAVALGLILLGCTPGGATSNLFTYYSRGDVALSISMTFASTFVAAFMMPLLMMLYSAPFTSSSIVVPYDKLVSTNLLVLVPVLLGLWIRARSLVWARRVEKIGSVVGIGVIGFVIASWIPQNTALLSAAGPKAYWAAILQAGLGFLLGYLSSRALGLGQRAARTVSIETGVQNTTLALGILMLSFPNNREVLVVPMLFAFLVIFMSIGVTLLFRWQDRKKEKILALQKALATSSGGSSLLTDLLAWRRESPNSLALAQKDAAGKWREFTTSDYAESLARVARALEALDFSKGDRALILARNSPEWIFSELGVTLVGGLVGGLYNNATAADFQHVFDLVKPSILFVEDKASFARLPAAATQSVRHIVFFQGECEQDSRLHTWGDFLQLGVASERSLESYIENLDTKTPSFIILTSGTTGAPKAAMLSHDNLYFAATCYRNRWNPPRQGALYSFLPASHVAEKVYTLGHGLHFHYPVYFASDLMNVLAEMSEVQPLAFLATPRIWQKMMERVQIGMRRIRKGLPARLLHKAQELSRETLKARMEGRRLSLTKRIVAAYLDRKILLPIRERLGLARAIKAVSGAAALPEDVRHFFRGLGINIIEAYAQTETSGICSGQLGDEDCAGTIGFPVPELEVKLADDGELLTRGRHVFCGYLDQPEATEQVIRAGWLHTGDLAEWNARGQLLFLGRKRDIIKPLEGKMIAPSKIEDRLMASPLVSQALVFGDGQKYLVALLTPDLTSPSTREQVELGIKRHVREVNRSLARHERVQKFLVLDREFSLEEGELTPTLKPKRHVIEKRFSAELRALYQEPAEPLRETEAEPLG